MATITFDTLKFVKKLEAAGVAPEQAEAFADAFRDAAGEAELATKRDIERMEAKIDRLDTRLAGEMTLIKWMMGIIIAAEAMPLLAKLFA